MVQLYMQQGKLWPFLYSGSYLGQINLNSANDSCRLYQTARSVNLYIQIFLYSNESLQGSDEWMSHTYLKLNTSGGKDIF